MTYKHKPWCKGTYREDKKAVYNCDCKDFDDSKFTAGEKVATAAFFLACLLGCLGLAYGFETVRAHIWANAMRNVGCSVPKDWTPPPVNLSVHLSADEDP